MQFRAVSAVEVAFVLLTHWDSLQAEKLTSLAPPYHGA